MQSSRRHTRRCTRSAHRRSPHLVLELKVDTRVRVSAPTDLRSPPCVDLRVRGRALVNEMTPLLLSMPAQKLAPPQEQAKA
eukprot:6195255-Pleurochrysis_carterae.AAC.1